MNLSETASRFDSSISWLAAIGNEAALRIFDDFEPDAIHARNRELTTQLRVALADSDWAPPATPEQNQSTIVSVPLAGADPANLLPTLGQAGIKCAVQDGNLRLAIHLYNHEEDIERLVEALRSVQ